MGAIVTPSSYRETIAINPTFSSKTLEKELIVFMESLLEYLR
jgi:hypothetical protein